MRQIVKAYPEKMEMDQRGNPIYAEKKHEQFALIVVRVNRDGKECGQV